jgi:hypothetical protein
MFKPISAELLSQDNRFEFSNNRIDAINISNILNHKEVASHVPQYFQNQTAICILQLSPNTIDRHDITEMLLKVALKTIIPFQCNSRHRKTDVEDYLQNDIKYNCS